MFFLLCTLTAFLTVLTVGSVLTLHVSAHRLELSQWIGTYPVLVGYLAFSIALPLGVIWGAAQLGDTIGWLVFSLQVFLFALIAWEGSRYVSGKWESEAAAISRSE